METHSREEVEADVYIQWVCPVCDKKNKDRSSDGRVDTDHMTFRCDRCDTDFI